MSWYVHLSILKSPKDQASDTHLYVMLIKSTVGGGFHTALLEKYLLHVLRIGIAENVLLLSFQRALWLTYFPRPSVIISVMYYRNLFSSFEINKFTLTGSMSFTSKRNSDLQKILSRYQLVYLFMVHFHSILYGRDVNKFDFTHCAFTLR